MDENNCTHTQSKHTMSFTRGNGTKRKQTVAKSRLLDDREKKSRYYIKNDATFNGTALSPNELMILWNKFKMHGHFRVEKDLQNFHANDERAFSTGQFHHHIDNNKLDQSNTLSTTTNKFFMNNNIYNDAFAYETAMNNNVTGSEVNHLEKIVYNTSADMYQEIPAYQFNNQCINNSYNPLDQAVFMDMTNSMVYNGVQSLSNVKKNY